MLADPYAEQSMESRKHDRHGGARRVTVRPLRRGDVLTRQFRDGERPADEPERLDQRRTRADDHGQDGERRRRAQDDGEQRAQWQHRERAEEQRLPAHEKTGATGVEPPKDLVGLPPQDVRVVERPAQLEEGDVEGDRERRSEGCR